MNTSVVVAVVAALANFLQGWDYATMAGVMIHVKKEFRWEDKPTMQGLAVASPLIGATLITLCSGGISASMGRRPILLLSSIFYFVSGLLMLWSPNVFLLLFARLLDGVGIGLAITFVPMYISEMSPPEVRGLLSTLPQLTYTVGFFLSYTLVFFMSLINFSNWRLMLGILIAPSFVLYLLMLFYMPESPRWLLSKGKMNEARQVLQILRGKDDVSSEMALLVEGLEVGGQTTIEQYVLGPPSDEEQQQNVEKEEIKLLDNEGNTSVVGLRVGEESFGGAGAPSRHTSIVQMTFSVDPVVALMDNVQEKLEDAGSKTSQILPNFGSMFSESFRPKNEDWDDTESERQDDDYESGGASESDDNLQSPLISRQTTTTDPPVSQKSICKINQDASVLPSSVSIGSGWQLAWKWKGEDGPDGYKKGSFQRLYLHEASGTSSFFGVGAETQTVDGDYTKAAALVSQSVFLSTNQMDKNHFGPAVVRPSPAAAGGPRLRDLLEPGVKHALFVGVGLQMLQQLLGANAVLLYTPQILEQAGVQVLLANLGISSESSSLLISAVMTMFMLPSVIIAMKLMDVSGRRSLLMTTNPVLTVSLVALVLVSVVDIGNTTIKAIVSTLSVISYMCFFSMGFGPIPSILCSEIFPTKVRGICIPICALAYWFCNITVSYTLPIMLSSIGLPGVFSLFAFVSLVSWAFVFFKVPETKGMPIEVIVEFFTVGANAKHNTS